ncbi:hypothetical protein CPB83DRAFT_846455 [Crepidotus variabilis]|uniref:Uncharacterized protein n=1 Tax=Crepidotus variabilis TaxID=179855 RepID=A0A9P6JUU3_9AGAR|nr:hypothetical protein CPB83DRAFT_846455 [Crepidotus variabilis]
MAMRWDLTWTNFRLFSFLFVMPTFGVEKLYSYNIPSSPLLGPLRFLFIFLWLCGGRGREVVCSTMSRFLHPMRKRRERSSFPGSRRSALLLSRNLVSNPYLVLKPSAINTFIFVYATSILVIPTRRNLIDLTSIPMKFYPRHQLNRQNPGQSLTSYYHISTLLFFKYLSHLGSSSSSSIILQFSPSWPSSCCLPQGRDPYLVNISCAISALHDCRPRYLLSRPILTDLTCFGFP